MKTIQRGDDIKRVKDDEVDKYISNGWKYVPKSVYKKQFKIAEPVVSEKKTKKNKDK